MTSAASESEVLTVKALEAKLRETDPAGYESLHILLDLLAPQVQLMHRPGAAMDGLVDGLIIREGLKQNCVEMELGAASYDYHVEQIEAHGNELHFAWRWRITMPDGRALDYTCAVECVLNGGQITEFISWQRATPDQLAIMVACGELGRAKLAHADDSTP